jgi:beta-galactosidase
VCDIYETPFGLRTIRFDADTGFHLNGQPLKLKGTCNHQDHAGVGVAVPDRVQEYRIKQLKEMGCNAYRCAHNPPAPELLDACDRLGMLVMDETRRMESTPEGLAQLESMLLRDRNHPSIILWSLGNEEPIQGTEVAGRIIATMKRLVRRLDPTRPTTIAMNGHWGSPVSQIVDVQGHNYFIHGYDDFRQQFPDKPVVAAENGSTVCTRGIYANDEERGYVSAYDINHPDWAFLALDSWKAVAERPWMAGTFVWTGFDYRGEPIPYRWPCINSHFGILDVCGFPKDNFYYYKAWWCDETVLHILPHWNWPGKEGQPIDVWVHSNCDEVELFVNGQNLGCKAMERNGHLEWQVNYAPGVLQAKGYRNGQQVATAERKTTGAPARIVLCPDRATLCADGEDVAMVNVSIVDV